ncbi:putative Integral membrane protein [Seiridium cardinale]
MSMVNESTEPPTASNSVGTVVNAVASVMLVIMTIIVGMRLWGRFRYKSPGNSMKASYGESRFWILMSDLTILVAYLSAIALSIAQFNYVTWGLGLHVSQLSIYQLVQAMKAFFAYQIIYKICSGLAKIASLFLLLAISTPNMHGFNLFCKMFATYIGLYSISTTLVTVFQCGTNFASNWNRSLDQSHCFYQPPFWYAHGVINLTASFVMAFLPWWLFATITYKRKRTIASIMSFLALAETALGAVRLFGLVKAAASSSDITFSSYIGLPVSQLEVDFATIAACIPTVLRLLAEAWRLFNTRVLGRTATYSSQRTGSNNVQTDSVHLSGLKSIDRGHQPSGPYTAFDKDDEERSMES